MRQAKYLALLAIVPFGFADDAFAGKKKFAETYFVRPDPAPDADAKGKLRLDTEVNKDRDKIEFKAENLDALATYHVFIEDAVGSGMFTDVGAMELDDVSSGEFDLKFDEKQGPLPLAVASVVDLVGRVVNIADAGNVTVLTAVVPDPDDHPGKNGWNKEKTGIPLVAPPVDLDAKGRVEVWFKGKDGRQRFRVHAEKLDPLNPPSVFVEDAVAAGTYTLIAVMESDGASGEYKLFLDTKQGAQMPFGVLSVDELAGRKVRVVDAALTPVLEGTIPDLFP